MNLRATLRRANWVGVAVLCAACATDAQNFEIFFESSRGTRIYQFLKGFSSHHGMEVFEVRSLEKGRLWRFRQLETGCEVHVQTDLQDLIERASVENAKVCRYIRANSQLM